MKKQEPKQPERSMQAIMTYAADAEGALAALKRASRRVAKACQARGCRPVWSTTDEGTRPAGLVVREEP